MNQFKTAPHPGGQAPAKAFNLPSAPARKTSANQPAPLAKGAAGRTSRCASCGGARKF